MKRQLLVLVNRGKCVIVKCQLDKISVHYESFGEGRPLITLHGFAPDHRLMKGCLEPTFKRRKGWKRVYPDLPGMGKTRGEPWITSSDQMLDVVLKFIDKVVPNQHFVLAGESYGGYLARAVAQKRRNLVDGLLLICPLIIADRKERILPEHQVLATDSAFLSGLDRVDLRDFESGHVVLTRRVWNRYRKEVLPGLKSADYTFLGRLEKEGYAFSFDLEAFTQIFEKPSLIVVGRQDASVGYYDAWSVVQKYPRMTFAVLDCAGHDLQIEQEKLFNALIDEWLDRVEESTSADKQKVDT